MNIEIFATAASFTFIQAACIWQKLTSMSMTSVMYLGVSSGMRTYSSRSGRYGSLSFLLCLTQFRTASNTGSSESTYTCTLTFRFVEVQTLVAKLTLFVASNFHGLDMWLLHATINLSPNVVITLSELMDCDERQEFNNTKGRCFCLYGVCIKQD